jgi:uncharacterized membrane protein
VVAFCSVVWVILLVTQLRWIHIPLSLGAQDALFMVCCTAAVGVGLGCQVPLQNVVGAFTVIGGLSLGIEILNGARGFPFGSIQYTDGIAGPRLVGIPWIQPLFWVMALIWARGFARVLLFKQRQQTWYGFALLFVTALLVVAMDVEWQRLAGRAHGHWLWVGDSQIARIRGIPWTRCFGVFAVAIGILFAAFPWFLSKKPVPTPLDLTGAWMWWMWMLRASLADGVRGTVGILLVEVLIGLWGLWAVRSARSCHPAKTP